MIRLKKYEIRKSNIDDRVAHVVVTLTDGEHDETFAMDVWEFIDDEKLAEILYNWTTKIFHNRKKQVEIVRNNKFEDIEKICNALKNINLAGKTKDEILKLIRQLKNR